MKSLLFVRTHERKKEKKNVKLPSIASLKKYATWLLSGRQYRNIHDPISICNRQFSFARLFTPRLGQSVRSNAKVGKNHGAHTGAMFARVRQCYRNSLVERGFPLRAGADISQRKRSRVRAEIISCRGLPLSEGAFYRRRTHEDPLLGGG